MNKINRSTAWIRGDGFVRFTGAKSAPAVLTVRLRPTWPGRRGKKKAGHERTRRGLDRFSTNPHLNRNE
jgi:hypothetical protein